SVARDARQTLGHLVVVLAHPLLVGRGVHPLLQRRDHVPHFHRRLPHPPATGSKQSSRSPSCRTRSFSQAAPLTPTSHVPASAPSAVRARDRRRHLHGRAVPALGQKPPEVAVHVHRHAHPSSARTRGMTSLWKRSMVVSIRPSTASG